MHEKWLDIGDHENYEKAKKILGYKNFFYCNHPDNQMDKVPLLKIIKGIEKIIEEKLTTKEKIMLKQKNTTNE